MSRLLCFSDAADNRNGVGTYYADLIDQLGRHMARAELVCPASTPGKVPVIVRFPMPGDATQSIYLPNPLAIIQRMKMVNPHTVLVPTPGPYGLLGAITARLMGKRLVYGNHTPYDRLTVLFWKNHFWAPLSRLWLQGTHGLLLCLSDVVVTVSDKAAHSSQATACRKMVRVGTPIAADFVHKPPRPLPEAPFSICYCGRLSPEKNIPKILAAAAELPEISFTIAGDGPLRDEVISAATRFPNLRYLGWVSRERILAVIDAAHLLLLVSREEAFGTIAIEAMARQRLVLVSEKCGILNWPALAGPLYILKTGESLAGAVSHIFSTAQSERTQNARKARQAALRFNTSTLSQWLALLGVDASETRVESK